MHLWHIVFTARGRRAFYRSEAELLAGLAALVRCAGGRLLLFCIVDEHVHVVVETSRPGDLESALHRALAATTPVPIESAHRTPVESRGHLQRLLGYLLGQPEKHGLPTPAALWCGSCFQDLIGARCLPGLRLQLPAHLPRFRPEDALAAVQLPRQALQLPGAAQLRRLGAARIVAAAATASGVTLPLGRSFAGSAARRAAAVVARYAGILPGELAFALGIQPRSARRLMAGRADPELTRAVGLRLALEELVVARLTVRTETGG
jgi:hypothetical protein